VKIRPYIPILLVSVLVPALVAYLMFTQPPLNEAGSWHHYLPHVNAAINSLTAGLLVLGLYFIRTDQTDRHRGTMISAFLLGGLFLISYIIYHSSVPSTVYGDLNHDGDLDSLEKEALGGMRVLYLSLLVSHISLSILVVPLVLLALYHAFYENFDSHLKVVKYAYPIWLYVSVTGVLVYFMIQPYYIL